MHPTPPPALPDAAAAAAAASTPYSVSPCQLDYDHPHRPLPPGIPPSFAHHGREREPSISSPSTRFISQVLAVPRPSRRAESSPNNIELSSGPPRVPLSSLDGPVLPCAAVPLPSAAASIYVGFWTAAVAVLHVLFCPRIIPIFRTLINHDTVGAHSEAESDSSRQRQIKQRPPLLRCLSHNPFEHVGLKTPAEQSSRGQDDRTRTERRGASGFIISEPGLAILGPTPLSTSLALSSNPEASAS